jgi:MoaA/NifB/PqqE/SkfB family radical SAM enzyme
LHEITILAKKLPNLLYLTISGGEPLLRDDLPEICAIFTQYTKIKHVTIPSNAFNPDKLESVIKKILQLCPKLLIKVCISVDGIRDNHDQMRGYQGLFNNVVNSIYRLKKLQSKNNRLSFLTNTVFTAQNQDQILSILDYIWHNLDIDYSTVVLARGDVMEPKSKHYSILKFYFLMQEIRRERLQRIKISNINALIQYVLSITVQDIIIYNASHSLRKSPCFALKNLLVVSDIGTVHACEPKWNDYQIGSIRESNYDLDGLLKNEQATKIRDAIHEKKCSCTWENAFQQALVFSPELYPLLIINFFKVLWAKLLHFWGKNN